MATTQEAVFTDIRRIAVVRGGGLGDLVFALPAIDALARTYPSARVTLIGTAAHRALLHGRGGPVSEVEVLPPSTPSGTKDSAAFAKSLRPHGFDLACQLHGGGRQSNPFTLRLGARHTVGARTSDAIGLERTVPYRYYQHEVLRWLEVASLAGAEGAPTARLEVHESERRAARRWAEDHRPLLVLHPGATDRRRRWPAGRFTEIARRWAGRGARVVVIGDGADAATADAVAGAADHPSVVSAARALTLGELLGLLSIADVFAGNDSGPRHLAEAVGTATVGIFWVGNAINGAPLTRQRHCVEIGWILRCPVCGADATAADSVRCSHDASYVADVPLQAVDDDIAGLLTAVTPRVTARTARRPGR